METDGGVAFSAYHVNLEIDSLESVILTELFDVAKIYSRRPDLNKVSYSYIPKDPETLRLLYEMERVKRALRKKGVDPDSYNQPRNNQPPQRGLIVDSRGVLLVPEYEDAQIKLNPRVIS